MIERAPLALEGEVLTTGLSGRSLTFSLYQHFLQEPYLIIRLLPGPSVSAGLPRPPSQPPVMVSFTCQHDWVVAPVVPQTPILALFCGDIVLWALGRCG